MQKRFSELTIQVGYNYNFSEEYRVFNGNVTTIYNPNSRFKVDLDLSKDEIGFYRQVFQKKSEQDVDLDLDGDGVKSSKKDYRVYFIQKNPGVLKIYLDPST